MHATESNRKRLDLRVGDTVEVRSVGEILATLDENGALDALPFMPEMLKYCGQRFRVYKRAHKTCDTIEKTGLRGLKDAVHLEGVRCDGEAHAGCQAGCLIFWNEAWLKKVSAGSVTTNAIGNNLMQQAGQPISSLAGPLCTRATLTRASRGPTDPADPEAETFRCQATQLREFTTYLSPWNVGHYVRDVRSGNIGLFKLIWGLLVYLFNEIQQRRGGRGYPFDVFSFRGQLTKTPIENLQLQSGEYVQVRSKEEIAQTLDIRNKNRGLWFDVEMLKYCGGKYRVLRRVEKIINEKTGKMIDLPRDCIILEGVCCAADYHQFCPRSIHHYWREIWLRRAGTAEEGIRRGARA